MSWQILQGDALEVLRQMPDQSVQTCVTSPPYYGLRDYGIPPTIWGGDPECAHEWGAMERGKRKDILPSDVTTLEARIGTDDRQNGAGTNGGKFCSRCGAWLGVFGLEPTPDLYCEHAVLIFREVRRVLRADGTLFLNLGDSYASNPSRGGSGSSPNGRDGRGEGYARALRAVPCDTSDKEPVGSSERDCLSGNLCDGCRAAFDRTSHNDSLPAPTREPSPSAPSHACTESASAPPPTSDSSRAGFRSEVASTDRQHEPAIRGDAVRGVPASTIDGPWQPQQGHCSHCANCGACLSVLRSSSRDARLCERKTAGIDGSTTHRRPLGEAPSGIESCVSAYPYSTTSYLKPKDLCGIPWMVAFALRSDGWWLRSDIIWSKPNPMPESVTDRPTKAHEYIFLLTKSGRYFYDAEAIAEPVTDSTLERLGQPTLAEQAGSSRVPGKSNGNMKAVPPRFGGQKYGDNDAKECRTKSGKEYELNGGQRNRRTVWSIATQPFKEAHFATFPPEIPEICIKAGTSERGCCAACGAPWERVVDRESNPQGINGGEHREVDRSGALGKRERDQEREQRIGLTRTLGWKAACQCAPSDPVPCTVLDPFSGAGTTGVVATRLQRNYIGIELSAEYCAMARRRIEGDAPLFNVVGDKTESEQMRLAGDD